jgi:SAM-dependent methyltransferase
MAKMTIVETLGVKPSELERQVLDTINKMLLPRKSFEFTPDAVPVDKEHPPLTVSPEARIMAQHILKSHGIEESGNGDEIKNWDRWWAREYAAAQIAIANKDYRDYLPGRYLMYQRLADTISDLFNRDVNGRNFIDLGSGSGLSLIRLASVGANAVGLDASKVALEFSQYLAEHYKVDKRLKLIERDFYATGLPSDSFDVTYNHGVFEHLADEQAIRLLQEMKRITQPGGYIMISIPNEESPFYQELKKKESNVHRWFKSLGWPRLPWEERRYPIDLESLMNSQNLEIVQRDGLLIAPSEPVKKGVIEPEDIPFFADHLFNGTVERLDDKMKFWKLLEGSASTEQRLRYGWAVYVVGQKK